MKTNSRASRFLIALLVLASVGSLLLLSSCSKDDDKIPNVLVIDGTSYPLSKGFITGYGVEEDENNNRGSVYEVLLSSSGINYSDGDFSGSGQVLYLVLFSRSTIELESGTYDVSDAFLEGKVIESLVFNGNITTSSGTLYFITGGRLTLSKSGDTWTFRFDFNGRTDSGANVTITGSYSGTLQEIE